MKTMKKTFAMLLAVLMLGALSCTAWADSADEVTFDNLKSYREDSTVTIDMEMSILGESQATQSKTTSTQDVTLDPECTFADMTTEANDETQHTLVYSMKDGTKYEIYTSNDEGATWDKQELDLADAANEALPTADSLKMIAGYTEKLKKTGTDEIHGRMADVYEGVLSGDDVQEFLMKAGGLGAGMDAAGVSLDGMDLSSAGEMPMTVALDQKTGMVLGYSADMGDFMQNMMESMMSGILSSTMEGVEMPEGFDFSDFLTIKVNGMKIDCTLYDFNQVDAIEMPKAA